MLTEYLAHYHGERNDQGADIGNKTLFPEVSLSGRRTGSVVTRSRLGGLLKYYDRPAA